MYTNGQSNQPTGQGHQAGAPNSSAPRPIGSPPDVEAYVHAALTLQGYNTAVVPAPAITEQFGRIAAVAATLLDLDLPRDADAATAFRP